MWVKLFFRHIAKSVKNQPLQPLLSALVLALAFLIAAMSFSAASWLTEETYLRQGARYGGADIMVTLNSGSQNRFLRPDIAASALGEGAEVVGCYELPVYTDGALEFAVATDFYAADNIFDIQFTSYGTVTPNTEDDSAFVSSDFASKHSLSVGDSFSAEVLGYAKTYVVCGISPRQFMDSFGIMVTVGGIVKELAKDSPFIAALGEDFAFYSSLYIKSGGDAYACADVLRALPAFADKTVTVVADEIVDQANLHTLGATLSILVVFIAITAAAVTFCCFYILSSRRSRENALFIACGANPRALLALQCAEIVVYWLIGGVVGCAAACALACPFAALCGLKYVTSPLGGAFALNCLKALAVTFAAALLTALSFYVSESVRAKSLRGIGKNAVKFGICALLLLTAASVLCTFVAPFSTHLFFGVASTVLAVALAFVTLPLMYRSAAKSLSECGRIKNPSGRAVALSLAVKNSRNVKTLHNTCRLLSVLIAMAVSLALVIASGYAHTNAVKNILDCDFVLLNADSNAAAKAEECDGVESVRPLLWDVAENADGDFLFAVSAKDYSVFSSAFSPDVVPEGNGVVLTETYSARYGYKQGDGVSFTIGNTKYDFVICGFTNSPVAAVYFDSEYAGIPYNVLSVSGDGALSSDELELDLASAMALDMAAIISPEEFLEQRLSLSEVYLMSGNALFISLIIFSAIGLCDNLYESYRSRRGQFALCGVCGMSPRTVARVKAWEIALTLAFSVLAGGILSAILSVLINEWMLSFGANLFLLLSL